MSKATKTGFIGKRSAAAGGWGALKAAASNCLQVALLFPARARFSRRTSRTVSIAPVVPGVIRNMAHLLNFAKTV